MIARANTGAMILIRNHPTSPLTGYPTLHGLKAFNGRIYLSYGDYFTSYTPNIIASYSPAGNVFRMEHSTGSDATDLFRIIDGNLYAPSADPIHYEDFRDYCYLTPGVGWRDKTPFGAIHLYDAAQLGADIFMSGARVPDGVAAGASLFRSVDRGETWTAVGGSGGRFYYCFTLGSKVWTQAGYFQGGGFTSSFVLSSQTYLYKATAVPGDGTFAVAISGRGPAEGTSGSLATFDGTTVRTLVASAVDFTFDGSTLYVLTSSAIMKATSLSATAATWTTLPIVVPASPRALEILDGVVYVAKGPGLYAARLDGTAYAPGTASVVNEMSDSFGRGLAFSGEGLVVGAPDASTTIPLSGAVSLWSELPNDSGWQQSASLLPPSPDYSGWFGKDVAAFDDLVAVVEAGHDTTNYERGTTARVHVYQRADENWISRAVLSVPFAHSAVFDDTTLYVGTANPAANQASGKSGISRYLITRDASGVPSFTSQVQLQPGTFIGDVYKPVGRVLRVEDRLIGGFAGDPSRAGGPGELTVWRKVDSQTFTMLASILSPSLYDSDRFGFALAGENNWLAVGAPRDDASAREAGKVYLFKWDSIRYVLAQTIAPPVVAVDGGFGSAIAMQGNKMLIGAPGVPKNGNARAGDAYLYAFNGEKWVLIRELGRPSGSIAEFGVEVALNDRWFAAGSRFSASSSNLTSRVALEPTTGALVHSSLAQWCSARGIDPSVTPLDTDLDSDGVSIVAEYASGLEPNTPDAQVYSAGAAAGLPSITLDPAMSNGSLLVSYLRPTDDGWLGAVVEAGVSPDALSPVSGTTVGSVPVGMHTLVTVRITPPVGATAYFARVRYGYP